MHYLSPDIKMVRCLFINDVLCMLEYYQYRETTHGFQRRNMAEGLTYKDVERVKGTGDVRAESDLQTPGEESMLLEPWGVPTWQTASTVHRATTQTTAKAQGCDAWYLSPPTLSLPSPPAALCNRKPGTYSQHHCPPKRRVRSRCGNRKKKKPHHSYAPNSLPVFVVSPQIYQNLPEYHYQFPECLFHIL